MIWQWPKNHRSCDRESAASAEGCSAPRDRRRRPAHPDRPARRRPDVQQRAGRRWSASRRRRVTAGLRRLQDLGVIRGFYTDIDPAAIGLSLQAMISVSLQANARGKIRSFIQQIRRKPQVMDVYFLAGADDFILHVAARDTDDLRVVRRGEPQRRRRRGGHADVADLRAPAGRIAAVE